MLIVEPWKCTIWRIYFFNKVLWDFPGLHKKIPGPFQGFQGFPGPQKFSRVFQDFQGPYEPCLTLKRPRWELEGGGGGGINPPKVSLCRNLKLWRSEQIFYFNLMTTSLPVTCAKSIMQIKVWIEKWQLWQHLFYFVLFHFILKYVVFKKFYLWKIWDGGQRGRCTVNECC